MPIIVAGCLECKEGVLSELLGHFKALVLLLLEGLDQTWCHHEIFLGKEGVSRA